MKRKMTLHSGDTGLLAAPQTRGACPCLGHLHSLFLLPRTLCPWVSTCLAPSFALVFAQMSSSSEGPSSIIQSKIAPLCLHPSISLPFTFGHYCLLSVSLLCECKFPKDQGTFSLLFMYPHSDAAGS